MNILSIQSHVAFGHAGNSAAVFPLQRLGIEVWPVHTVQFSSHTGYGPIEGDVFSADLIRRVTKGIAERGVLGECDGILSGYLGSADIGEAVLETVDAVKSVAPLARYCCDPVIGNAAKGVFVQPGIPEFIKERALPAADVATPNQFELEFLSGRATRSFEDVQAAIDILHGLGPRIVLVTSLRCQETPRGSVDLIASEDGVRYHLRTAELPESLPGSGDLIAALFLAHSLLDGSVAEALSRAASSMFSILRRSIEQGSRELLLIECQDELVDPEETFTARGL
jgi:pyridoxine kinase